VRHGDNLEGVLLRSGVWQRRQPLVKKALSKFKAPPIENAAGRSRTRRPALKGVFPAEPWTTLTDLLVAPCCVRPIARGLAEPHATDRHLRGTSDRFTSWHLRTRSTQTLD
jgi:hypothetical protein